MIISGTGHRPNKLIVHGKEAYPGTFSHYRGYAYSRLVDLAFAYLRKEQPTKVISGVALGWDMALAQAAIYAQIPFIAAVPFKGQESQWPRNSQEYYHGLLAEAEEVHYIVEGEYAPWKMQVRNEWMVDHSNVVLALWNGTPGGTANCLRYAEKTPVRIINAWDSWEKHKEDTFEFSNFHLADVQYDGIIYPSVENYYQAMKTTNPVMRQHIATLSPAEAKKLGRKITLRTDVDWDEVKMDIMREGLRRKFTGNKGWETRLRASGRKGLVEWNTWGDKYWGVDIESEEGQNWLGYLLMDIREELQALT